MQQFTHRHGENNNEIVDRNGEVASKIRNLNEWFWVLRPWSGAPAPPPKAMGGMVESCPWWGHYIIIFPFKSRLYFSGVARACEASQCCGWVVGVQENPVCLQLRCLIWFQPIPSTSSYQFNEFCIWVPWTLRVRVSYDTGEPLAWRW